MAGRSTRRTAGRGSAGAGGTSSIPSLAWHAARPAPVVLVFGAEEILATRAISRIRQALAEQHPGVEVNDLDASGYGAGELLTLASPSLFAEPRLIRADHIESSNDAFLDDALAYLAEPAEDTTLVLRHHGGVRGKRLLDAVRSGLGGGIEVACAPLKREQERAAFLEGEFSRAGRRADPAAIHALVAAFPDLAALAAAAAQLVSDTDGAIGEDVVRRYYAGRTVVTGFAVADAAIAGRTGQALVALRQALDSGVDPVPIVAALASKIRTMARVAGRSGSDAAIARSIGLAPWQVERARRDLRGWDDTDLADAIVALAEADAGVKGASRDAAYVVEKTIRVVSARARR